MIAAIRLVRSVLGDEAGLKKTQTEVLGLAKFTFCFCFVLVCFFLFFFVLSCMQVRRLHGFDVSKDMVRKVVEEAKAADSSGDDEAARAAAADAKRKKREEDAAAASKLKLENLVNEGKRARAFNRSDSLPHKGKAGVAGQWTSVRIVNLKDEELEAAAASVKFNAGLRLDPHPPHVFSIVFVTRFLYSFTYSAPPPPWGLSAFTPCPQS
jgi:hypothetical protein